MPTQRSVNESVRKSGMWLRGAARVVLAGLLVLVTLPAAAQDKKTASGKDEIGFGLTASKQASAKEIGLPLYPGAREHKDKAEDSPAVQLGMWAGASGFKLVVLKLESDDAPEKVAAFYRKELAKYGRVLHCDGASGAGNEKGKSHSPSELSCEDDRPEKGGLLLKAGTKQRQHIVGITPNGNRSHFQLVYVETRGSDDPQ
jgi:hypothetical protein